MRFNFKNFRISCGLLLAFALGATSCAWAASSQFSLAIYKNETCSGEPAGRLKMDTAKSCVNYSYVDSKGVTTHGSNGHFHCYPDKVVFDKYPFASDCSKKATLIDRAHSIPTAETTCQRAPSHEGDVFEKILNYLYPGNENCRSSER